MSEQQNKDQVGKENDGRTDPVASPSYAMSPLQFRLRGSTITSASPPQFVSLEEIMRAAHGIQNMSLAHEIAIQHDFKLEPFQPPDNSYEKLIKDTMHKAFFDILREQLNSVPPVYMQAIVLLQDVKKGLFSILLPRHTRIKQMIEEVLDTEFIKQQAENGALDFQKYANFVLDLMSKLAAPARDEMIQNIRQMTDTVEIFRNILETLDVLKLDLANTLIAMIRPHVQAQSVEYERNKFQEILNIQEDGLQHTRSWILRNLNTRDLSLPITDKNTIRNVTSQTLAKAYLELLEWDPENTYPETMEMDASRFAELAWLARRVCVVASVCLVAPSANSQDPNLVASHKSEMKKRLMSITESITTNLELKKCLPSLYEEVVQCTEQFLHQYNYEPLTMDTKEIIRNNILALQDEQHRVRTLVWQRLKEFLREILVCGGGSKPVPVGLSSFSEEITSIAGTLLRYVMYNKSVYTSYYLDIVESQLTKTY